MSRAPDLVRPLDRCDRAAPSSWHGRRTDSSRRPRSTSARRSGPIIFRPSSPKFPLDDQLRDPGVQLPDVALAVGPSITAAAFERSRHLLQKLPLPGVNLVRMNLLELRHIGHPSLAPAAPRAQASPSAPRQSSVSSSASFSLRLLRRQISQPVRNSGATSARTGRPRAIISARAHCVSSCPRVG